MMLSPSGCGHREEVVEVDFTAECSDTGEYAKEIFTYLREAEVYHIMYIKHDYNKNRWNQLLMVPLGGIVLTLGVFITLWCDN